MTFYVRNAWNSLQRSRGLTIVMIVALALGIATWYVQHQIFAFLESKTPEARDGVFQVGLDRGDHDASRRPSNVLPIVPSILLTPADAVRVLDGGGARRKTITFSAQGLIEPEGKAAEIVRVRYATRDLFELFAIPMSGRPWSAVADAGLFGGTPGDEVVIDERLARRVFGGDAIGRTLRVDGAVVRVVGVVPASHDDRYHLYERFVPGIDAVYLPLAHASAAHAEPNYAHVVHGQEPGYLSVWVEPTSRDGFAGRGITLRSAAEWRVVFAPGGTINTWPLLAGLCLATIIVNLVRMLMAKFAGRGRDLGLLRAFGARRRAIMGQLLLEAMLIGLIAAVLGIVLGVAMMPLAASTVAAAHGSPSAISFGGVIATLGASIGAALLAAIYPAWRLARGTPAVQMRGQAR